MTVADQTPIYGFRYQELSDPPHGPNLGKNLADDVEDELTRVESRVTTNQNDIATANANIATNTADITQLETDVAGFGTVTTFTPVWSTSGVQPVLGNGAMTGEYSRVADLVLVRVSLVWGSTTTGGTNAWSFSLPAAITASYNVAFSPWPIWSGGVVMRDVSALAYHMGSTIIVSTGDNIGAIFTSGQVGATLPFTWANGDFITMNSVFRAA